MSPKRKITHKLLDVVRRELGLELDKEQQRADWAGELDAEMQCYAARDSEILLPLHDVLATQLREDGLEEVAEIEHRALPAVAWMARAGVPFDGAGWGEHLEKKEAELSELTARLDELAPDHPDGGIWNWNSPQQISDAFGLFGIELENTKKETLSGYVHPLANALLEYREVKKLVGTYGPSLLEKVESGRIYTSWWQLGAGTGRMACSNPNLQNLPSEVRRYVRAPEGRKLIAADYSQIELRLAARISGDRRMTEAFANDEDIHRITAQGLTGREEVTDAERKLAKAVNFGLLYGMSPGGLRHYARSSYGVEMTYAQAEAYWQGFFATYPGLKAWHDWEYGAMQREGVTESRTLSGRRRTGISKFTERLNSPVQGSGADGLKLALALLWERRRKCPGAVPILAVHDEIVVECPEADSEQAERWLVSAMVDGMNRLLNDPAITGTEIPAKVESRTVDAWAA